MASKPCTVCLRALQRQSRSVKHFNKASTPAFTSQSRAFATTASRYQVMLEPNATPSAKDVHNLPTSKLLEGIKKAVPKLGTTGTYTAYGTTEQLFAECSKQADYNIPQAQDPEVEMPKTAEGEDLGIGKGWWNESLGLHPGFSTWSQVTMLHMYMLTVRFRNFPHDQSSIWQQHLLDHFFYDAENRMMVHHNMHARGTRNKYLKDLFIQFRGLLAAYDEGLVKGDPVLASAVWRNVFKGNENVDIEKLATIVSYMRRVLDGVSRIDDQAFQMSIVEFPDPMEETKQVQLRSRSMDIAVKDETVQQPDM